MISPATVPTATLLHLQRLSTEDGPGIRTTVFFKGCPLRCAWCHNPESLLPGAQVQWLENRCIGCRSCVEACPQSALSCTSEGIVRDRARCAVCGACVEACPSGAMELLGTRANASDLAAELLKDRSFFEKSGGGITFSGGEPTLQPRFLLALIEKLQPSGVPVALDTCGLCPRATLEQLVPGMDLILYDLKFIDPTLHERWTRSSNRAILDNLIWLGRILREQYPNITLWVRTPLIPGVTATAENLQAIGAFLGRELGDTAQRWELCAFNNLCRDKYRRLGMDWQFKDTPLMTQSELDQAAAWARSDGFNPKHVFVTGAARPED